MFGEHTAEAFRRIDRERGLLGDPEQIKELAGQRIGHAEAHQCGGEQAGQAAEPRAVREYPVAQGRLVLTAPVARAIMFRVEILTPDGQAISQFLQLEQ